MSPYSGSPYGASPSGGFSGLQIGNAQQPLVFIPGVGLLPAGALTGGYGVAAPAGYQPMPGFQGFSPPGAGQGFAGTPGYPPMGQIPTPMLPLARPPRSPPRARSPQRGPPNGRQSPRIERWAKEQADKRRDTPPPSYRSDRKTSPEPDMPQTDWDRLKSHKGRPVSPASEDSGSVIMQSGIPGDTLPPPLRTHDPRSGPSTRSNYKTEKPGDEKGKSKESDPRDGPSSRSQEKNGKSGDKKGNSKSSGFFGRSKK